MLRPQRRQQNQFLNNNGRRPNPNPSSLTRHTHSVSSPRVAPLAALVIFEQITSHIHWLETSSYYWACNIKHCTLDTIESNTLKLSAIWLLPKACTNWSYSNALLPRLLLLILICVSVKSMDRTISCVSCIYARRYDGWIVWNAECRHMPSSRCVLFWFFSIHLLKNIPWTLILVCCTNFMIKKPCLKFPKSAI